MGNVSGLNYNTKIYQNPKIGTIFIELEKQYYYPGMDLTGKIYVNLKQDLEIVGLDFIFQRNEDWNIKGVKDKPHSDLKVENLLNESINIQNRVVYKEEKVFLTKGENSFPFKFKIPNNQSPSFEFIKGSDFIHLRYMIYAVLISPKGENYCLSNVLFVLLKSLPLKIENNLTYSSCVNLKYFMIDQGTCIMNFFYDRLEYNFDEGIKLRYSIDNSRAFMSTKEFKVKIFRKIFYKEYKNCDKFVCEEVLSTQIINVNCPAGISISDQFLMIPFEPKIDKKEYQNFNTPYLHLFKNETQILKLQPSINSNFIRCEYSVKITLYFTNFVNSNYRPRVIIPFSLYNFIQPNVNEI